MSKHEYSHRSLRQISLTAVSLFGEVAIFSNNDHLFDAIRKRRETLELKNCVVDLQTQTMLVPEDILRHSLYGGVRTICNAVFGAEAMEYIEYPAGAQYSINAAHAIAQQIQFLTGFAEMQGQHQFSVEVSWYFDKIVESLKFKAYNRNVSEAYRLRELDLETIPGPALADLLEEIRFDDPVVEHFREGGDKQHSFSCWAIAEVKHFR